jgi:hypothetical protein
MQFAVLRVQWWSSAASQDFKDARSVWHFRFNTHRLSCWNILRFDATCSFSAFIKNSQNLITIFINVTISRNKDIFSFRVDKQWTAVTFGNKEHLTIVECSLLHSEQEWTYSITYTHSLNLLLHNENYSNNKNNNNINNNNNNYYYYYRSFRYVKVG